MDQGFVAEIDQHGTVLIVEPVAEEIETTVWRPSRCVVEPACPLLDKDLVAQFEQDPSDFFGRFASRNSADRRLQFQFLQRQVRAGWIYPMQPVQEELLWLDQDSHRLRAGGCPPLSRGASFIPAV
jgi:hypothetical protein